MYVFEVNLFLSPGGDGEGRGLGVREARPEVSHGSLATISLPPSFHYYHVSWLAVTRTLVGYVFVEPDGGELIWIVSRDCFS